MNIKETFLKLTEFTNPYGTEPDLLPLLPRGVNKDKWGNYFIKVGESDTLFTTHLDNYCDKKMKVNHVIKGNIIATDEKTILGGDNKAGVTALLYMIENKVPGTYYFFCGEEPILSGGLYGSSRAAYYTPNTFIPFKRAVAFDRKKMGSIVTRQSAQPCCSDEFASALIVDFKKHGIPMVKDPTGYYTDTASFLGIIPECTNISIGVWNEHHKEEFVNIRYVEIIANAACKINWDNLPSVRLPGDYIKDEKDIDSNKKKCR